MKPVKNLYGAIPKDLVVGLNVDINRINHIKFAAGDGLQKFMEFRMFLEKAMIYRLFGQWKAFQYEILSSIISEDGGPLW